MVSGAMIPVIYTAALSKQIELHTLEITSYTNLGTKIYEGLIYIATKGQKFRHKPHSALLHRLQFSPVMYFFLGRHTHILNGGFTHRPCNKFLLVYNVTEIMVNYIKVKDLSLKDLTIFFTILGKSLTCQRN